MPRESGPGIARTLGGWGWLALSTASLTYLTFLLSLAAIALLPALFGWHGSVVQSGSMRPHINPGDVVLSTNLPSESAVPVGGVVEFSSPAFAEPSGVAKTRLHRIVSANDDGTFDTAGDANKDIDSTPISRDQISGQARLLVPYVGLPSLWIGTGNFPALTTWAVLTLIALSVVILSKAPRELADAGPDGAGTGSAGGTTGESGAQRPRALEPAKRVVARSSGIIAALAVVVLLVPGGASMGAADAAFTDRTSTSGNSWQVAVGKSKATSRLQVNDTSGADGWYQRSSVEVQIFASASSGSGIRSITYRINGGTPVTVRQYSAEFKVTTQGDNTITYFATDTAGRAEAEHSTHIKLDNRPPVLTVSSRTGDMTHTEWSANCKSYGISGGLCGDTSDAGGSGIGTASYVLRRSSDSRCFDGSKWTGAACERRASARISGAGWYVSVPDSKFERKRTYYTITVFVTDKVGNEAITTKNFSVG
ncbi:hypothetical protein LWF01_18935 [Saxibacter everestensis]|uniref:Signal peptidase I n=1 Tax=Saxibacter everestensis TaxID=2909229 RepID=A0ABY8QT25_9MICO|nr:hypothetical protein LWF01_18935 [Brevibacteriaceae bacterium ZFBP1038]